jgi:hypothetical protein
METKPVAAWDDDADEEAEAAADSEYLAELAEDTSFVDADGNEVHPEPADPEPDDDEESEDLLKPKGD